MIFLSIAKLRILFLVLVLIAISVIDARKRVIPNATVVSIVAIQVLSNAANAKSISSCLLAIGKDGIAGFVCLAAVMFVSYAFQRIRRKDSLGGGDVKLIGSFGFSFGYYGAALSLLIACITAFGYSCFMRLKPNEEIPFGPFLAAGAVVCLILGY